MPEQRTFEDLVAEGEAEPTEGWDFSWFDGRATEERPSWGYARLIGERMRGVGAALDVQTGGGEVLATIPEPPPLLRATESWPPNLEVARRNLAPLGAEVAEAPDTGPLPYDVHCWGSENSASQRVPGQRSTTRAARTCEAGHMVRL